MDSLNKYHAVGIVRMIRPTKIRTIVRGRLLLLFAISSSSAALLGLGLWSSADPSRFGVVTILIWGVNASDSGTANSAVGMIGGCTATVFSPSESEGCPIIGGTSIVCGAELWAVKSCLT